MIRCILLLLLPTFAFAQESKEVEDLKKRVEKLEAEVRELKKLLAPATAAKPGTLDLRVAKEGWKDAGPADIRAVCLSAANEIAKHCPDRKFEPILISNSKQGPMAVYGVNDAGERRVLLNVEGSFWSQFAYQFAHEFCHNLCNYRESTKQNHWFEESLCETASLFALRRMAETWKTNPPYANWKSYAESLHKYIDDHLAKIEKLDGMTLAQWYARNEDALRKNSTDRPKNQIAARAMLELFEKTPGGWAALESLNKWEKSKELTFAEYLGDWRDRVPEKHKAFVASVAEIYGIALKK